MKKITAVILALVSVMLIFASCEKKEEKDYVAETYTDKDGNEHTEFYIEGYTSGNVIKYFDEVVLDSEYFSGEGNSALVQKWKGTVEYTLLGDYTQTDLQTIKQFFSTFKDSPGFPEVEYSREDNEAALKIYFLSESEFSSRTSGLKGKKADGTATYNFNDDTNEITSGVIYFNNEMEDYLRKSVVLEEVYNVMGVANDTLLRKDSIIYQHFSTVEELSDMDVLIMRLLYLPNIKCGMDKEQVNAVIEKMYY